MKFLKGFFEKVEFEKKNQQKKKFTKKFPVPKDRDAKHSDFCEIILVFKADFRILILNFKITAYNDFKMVPDKITGVTPTSALIIPDHG